MKKRKTLLPEIKVVLAERKRSGKSRGRPRKQHTPGDILIDRLLVKSHDDALGMKKSLIRKRENAPYII